MNVWFAPQEDNTLQNAMGIAGCTVRKWSGEAAVQARYGVIDLVEAAGAILGLDQETAWTLLKGRFTAPKGMTGNVALVWPPVTMRPWRASGSPPARHVRDRLAGKAAATAAWTGREATVGPDADRARRRRSNGCRKQPVKERAPG